MDINSTIAAVATASGPAGIAIVRVSGPESIAMARRLFRPPGASPDWRARRLCCYGRLYADGKLLDEIVLLLMRAPRSYTGEDVVEFQCHGGGVTVRRVLAAVLAAGARPAEPGEFTRRAFLNGRLDLTQAEAVLDLVQARTRRAADAALEQLAGRLGARLRDFHELAMRAAADIEAVLDFTEDDMPREVIENVAGRLRAAGVLLADLLATWQEGHLLREGARVVIAGRPNVGKSTLLNALLETERAIVDSSPGTTRDTIEESLLLGDQWLRLTDTAGLRGTDCTVEQEGVRRARALAEQADLVLYVVDASLPPQAGDYANLERLPAHMCLVLLNKSDLPARTGPGDFARLETVKTALTRRCGLAELKTALLRRLSASSAGTAPHVVISARHRLLLEAAAAELHSALELLAADRDDLLVPAASAVRAAVEQVGLILGRHYHPELLDEIFSRYCVGK